MIRSYTELSKIKTFEDRFEYLKLQGTVGKDTFGYDRYLNQVFYKDPAWKHVRDKVIIRDGGCDLGIEDRLIGNRIIVHHMNPITIEDILNREPWIMNPEFLICTSNNTHQAIHYSDKKLLLSMPIDRKPNDTCPWKV